MSSARSSKLVFAAAAALAVSVLVGLWGVSESAQHLRRIERKAADLERIQSLRQPLDQMRAMSADLEARSAAERKNLRDLLRELQPGGGFEIREEEPRLLEGRWALRRAEVVWPSIAQAEFGGVLEALESARPPWRMVACSLTAGPEAGYLRANLTLEHLEIAGE